ncbi:uncharacterized protein LOC127802002 isoform X2 [Diospyros lotus]|uniref:uncharacterized protein LOC127802002 isoform X2 n=1 Tax=Diospyros lotus TaxID=55363 RepID=UPI00224F23A1|nr:uncharacterized protein LOC127802002 isoform X2 [Diospyros lotus]
MASAKRKDRTLDDLYTLTRKITHPEALLRGTFQMQGPADETDCDIQTNMVLSQDERGLGKHSKSQKVSVGVGSGACNVCSTPCTSCLHINQTIMGSKTDESSDETFQGNAGSQYSVNDALPVKNSASDTGQHTTSDTSYLVSVNSNHDSLSENEESKDRLRTSDVSGASDDIEMHRNLSIGVTAGDNGPPPNTPCSSDQRASVKKIEDQRVLEVHEDNISCVSGGNDASKLPSYDNDVSVDRKEVPQSAVSDEFSSQRIDLIEIPSSKGKGEGVSSSKVPSTCSCPTGGTPHSCNLFVRDLKEDLGNSLPAELPEFSKEHLSSPLTKETTSEMVCQQRSPSHTCGETTDSSLVRGISAASQKVCLNMEAETETNKDSCDMPVEAVTHSEQEKENVKFKDSFGLPNVQEPLLQSQPEDDCDESDISEHDVKVCDICGDAGREDLLAICSRCSDGAEHTYCMREMMEKIPDGDWLCEECKFDEIKKSNQDKIAAVDGNDANQSPGLASALNTNLPVKFDKKDSDQEGNKTNKEMLSVKASVKRHAENIEVSPAVKRQALESTASPKTSSPSRISALSRDSSFRNLDKGKVKPARQLSTGTSSINDTSEAAFSSPGPKIQTSQGTLLKSNSFNSTNAKPKVKLVNEVVPLKHKSARDPVSLDMKEGAARLIGKSLSFKSAVPGRLNPSEPKVKLLSPKFSGQDLKGLKPAKEWNLLEKRNSFKLERSLASSAIGNTVVSTVKGDKKLASHGESYSLPSVSNNREPKGVQSDSKLTTSTKSASHVPRRGSEMPVPLGEIKKQSCSSSVAGVSSANGISGSAEQKPTQTSVLHDSSPSTFTAERPSCNANESTNSGERTREGSAGCTRPGITAGGRNVTCQKCKEIGHSGQSCPVDNPRSLLGDVSATRSSREVMDKGGNKLKAAIEAAMLKKPGMYRKNKMPNQSDESLISSRNLNSELHPQDQLLTSINTNNISPSNEVREGRGILRKSTAESCKQTTVNMNQSSVFHSEAGSLKNGDASPVDPSDGKLFLRDLPCDALGAFSILLKMSPVPEREYIWQGSFEVQKSGKLPEFQDGIQAHLSTYASPKVLEVVNKFSSKILLNEVPRLSTWPIQFQETGAKEENIALYFFAKDLESYEKSYKSLLENMMKSDLALRGNIDGVEVLIFPSNHLPDKFQRWNMLYFLWGVLRGKKVNCLQTGTGSPKEYSIEQDLPTAILSLPESICSLGPVDGNLPVHPKACNVTLAPKSSTSMESPCLSSETVTGDYDTNASSFEPKGQCTQTNAVGRDSRRNATSSPRTQGTGLLSFQKMNCTSPSLDESGDPGRKLEVILQPSVQAAETISSSRKNDKMPMCLDDASDIQQVSSRPCEILGTHSSRNDQVSFEKLKEEEGSLGSHTVLQRNLIVGDQSWQELTNWQYNQEKRLNKDSTWTSSRVSAGGSQMSSWDDVQIISPNEGFASKKQRTGYGGLYVSSSSRATLPLPSRESFLSEVREMCASSLTKERGIEACDQRGVSRNNGAAERFFFPVDPHPVIDLTSDDNPISWKDLSAEDSPDGAPDLDLALGAKMKPAKQGMLPFLVGKGEPKDEQGQRGAEKAATKGKEDDVSASLSLSLSFPFPDKEATVKPGSRVEQLVPSRRQANNPSLLLFGGLSDK